MNLAAFNSLLFVLSIRVHQINERLNMISRLQPIEQIAKLTKPMTRM